RGVDLLAQPGQLTAVCPDRVGDTAEGGHSLVVAVPVGAVRAPDGFVRGGAGDAPRSEPGLASVARDGAGVARRLAHPAAAALVIADPDPTALRVDGRRRQERVRAGEAAGHPKR